MTTDLYNPKTPLSKVGHMVILHMEITKIKGWDRERERKKQAQNENEFLKSLPKEYIDLHLEVVTIVVSWTCAPEKSII